MALSELAANNSPTLAEIAGEVQEVPNTEDTLEGFHMFCVVKETGVDDEGLASFHGYFEYPTYKDEKLVFYKALGNRRMGAASLMSMMGKYIFKAKKRLQDKKIEMNYLGEGLIQGGVIVFDKSGVPRFCYKEKTGDEMPIEDVLAAANAVRSDAK